jgi:hypothetical protein
MNEASQVEFKKYFDISETRQKVNKLKEMLKPYVGKDVSKEEFRAFTKKILNALSKDLAIDCVQPSIAHLHGRPITQAVVNETAWRLAGNVDALRAGEVVTQDVATRRQGWCALQVVSVKPILMNPKSKDKKKRGSLLSLFVMSGHAAGCRIDKFFSLSHLKYLSKEIGFTAPFKEYPYRDEREFFGLRFGGLFLSSLVRDNKPGFSEVCSTATMNGWNKDMFKRRKREGFACALEMNYEQLPCFRCFMGAESCSAAVHQKDFEQDVCAFCGLESMFDPDSPGYALDMCVNCERHQDITGLTLTRKAEDAGN